jgi:hypothetical protein
MRSDQLRSPILSLLVVSLAFIGCAKPGDPVDTGLKAKPPECTAEITGLHQDLLNQLKNYRILKSATNEKSLKGACLKYQKGILELAAKTCETQDLKTKEKTLLLPETEAEACKTVGADPTPAPEDGKEKNPDPNQPANPTGPAAPSSLNSDSKGVSVTVLQADIMTDLISSGTGVVLSRGQVLRSYKDIDKQYGYCIIASSRTDKKLKAAQVLRFSQVLPTEDQPNVFIAISKDGDLRLSCGWVKKTRWTVQDLAEIFAAAAQIQLLR